MNYAIIEIEDGLTLEQAQARFPGVRLVAKDYWPYDESDDVPDVYANDMALVFSNIDFIGKPHPKKWVVSNSDGLVGEYGPMDRDELVRILLNEWNADFITLDKCENEEGEVY